MNAVFRILLALFLLQTATTNGEVLLSTLNNRQSSLPLHALIGNYFGEYFIGSVVVQTGKNPDGYTLNSVTLTFDDASGSPINFTLSLSELPTSNDRPIHLTGSRTPRRAGRYTYRPESRYFLKPNTEYLFGVHAPGNAWNNLFLLPGTRVDERVRSSDGWRITYTAAYRVISGDVELISKGGVPLIAIDATKISPPKPTPPPLSGDATLRSLALSSVPINFASNRYQYSASVSHTTASTTVTAFPSEPTASVSIVPADADANTAGHQVALTEGNNAIVVTVTAPNGNRRIYSIAVRRALPPLSGDATLRSLTLSGVPINFASNRYQYSASVSHPTASTTVTAFPNEPTARVSISPNDANTAKTGHQIALSTGNNSIAITVTAPNGNRRTYTIAVRRALPPLSGDATLRSLTLSGVPINFANNINHYSASVSHPTSSTTVTAIANEPTAIVSIVPADAYANTAGHQVALTEGNNAIVVTVTAPNGNSRAYTVTIRRALSTPTPLPPPTLPTPTPQPKPSLSIRKVGNLIDIRWSGGTLQHAPSIDGPWKDVHVSSPLQLNRSWWRSSEFFRVR